MKLSGSVLIHHRGAIYECSKYLCSRCARIQTVRRMAKTINNNTIVRKKLFFSHTYLRLIYDIQCCLHPSEWTLKCDIVFIPLLEFFTTVPAGEIPCRKRTRTQRLYRMVRLKNCSIPCDENEHAIRLWVSWATQSRRAVAIRSPLLKKHTTPPTESVRNRCTHHIQCSQFSCTGTK